MKTVHPKRDLSLIERAAEVYDFGAAFRSQPVVVDEPASAEAPRPEDENRHLDQLGANGEGEGASLAAPFVSSDVERPLPAFAEADAPTLPRADNARVEAIDRARLAQMGMIVPGAPIGSLAEEFRLIKRQLLITAERLPGAQARTILVGSAKPADGKTYCAINLALSIAAERDTEVLLVDADFAKPDVMAKLGLDDGPGLLDILADPAIDPETLVVRTDVPNLSLLPVGTKTNADTELLASRRTVAVIDMLLAAHPKRIIIFDTPPALAASPASVLALQVGQVMLVVRADRTTESDVRRSVQILDGCEQIQLVLNSVSFVPGGNRFGSYYGQGD